MISPLINTRSFLHLSSQTIKLASPHLQRSQVTNTKETMKNILSCIVTIIILSVLTANARGRKVSQSYETFEYTAITCRSHSASITDFGGVGDGKTLNTKAFQSAVDHLSQYSSDGGAQLFVPAGKWLTGSFSLTSHFTLFLHKDATLLAAQDLEEYPILKALPSYGRGRDAAGGRFASLVFGTNLTDVIITGNNGTIDGQGSFWWQKFHGGKLKYTRPYLIELMFSDTIQISNITLIDSPSWNIHPVYSSNIIVKGVTIIAPVKSPNTDGINPDSCTNTRIEDCYIISGDDCVAVKSGWDEYGISFGMPTKHLIIRRLTCISPYSAAIALGSEMSGGIEDVRAEDITAYQTESGVRIKTAVGRGAFVRNVYVKGMSLHTMKWVFWMTGNYKAHADTHYDPHALPEITGINYRDIVADNVSMAGRLEGISGDPFTGICISNATISMAVKHKKVMWMCSDVEGVTSGVDPKPCGLLDGGAESEKNKKKVMDGGGCEFPTDVLEIDNLVLKSCSYQMS